VKRISLLGSTGSIGRNTLRIASEFRDRFEIGYLACGRNHVELIRQARKFKPIAVAIYDQSRYKIVKEELASENIEVLAGQEGINELASRSDIDIVVNAIVGSKGLEPTYHCVRKGIALALSNKESIVMAGEIIMGIVKKRGVSLRPIDSEHSAIWQCLLGEDKERVKRIILTGSGGPFRKTPKERFDSITPKEALKHPTWRMGSKITIDSATLMNKGLEVIEAKWLFDMEPDKIDVVIHPQSIVHSLVEFVDGSVKAQLGIPDMKLPIQFALSYPERLPRTWERLNLEIIKELTFEEPDIERFPCLRLAFEALRIGGNAPAILNVANENAVYAFLESKIKFSQIPMLIEKALTHFAVIKNPVIEEILETEKEVKEYIRSLI